MQKLSVENLISGHSTEERVGKEGLKIETNKSSLVNNIKVDDWQNCLKEATKNPEGRIRDKEY